MVFTSKIIEEAVGQFSKMPGVGKKSALRMVLQLLKMDKGDVGQFIEAIQRLKEDIVQCSVCFNIADKEICDICSSPARQRHQVCIVENIRDVIAIESTQQYNGLYHVIGGILSPIDGIGPDQLNIASLPGRIADNDIEELIMALSPTMEGDTTVYYIARKVIDLPVKITTIARGISFGGELEYADEMTLARSIARRLPIENYVNVGGK